MLSDTARRRTYDQFGVDDESGAGGGFPGGFGGGAASNPGVSRNARRRRRGGGRPGPARHGGRVPTNLEEELDDLLNSMSPEQVFEFLFTAAGNGVGGRGGGGGRDFGASFFDGGDSGGPAAAAPEAGASLWTRYKPLTMLLALGLFLMLLGGAADEVRFSLRETPSMTSRRATPCGVDYFTSRFHRVDALRDDEAERLHTAVHREASVMLRERCADEQAMYARLQRGATAWISVQSSRDWYARKAVEFRATAQDCARSRALLQCVRDHDQMQRTQRRRRR